MSVPVRSFVRTSPPGHLSARPLHNRYNPPGSWLDNHDLIGNDEIAIAAIGGNNLHNFSGNLIQLDCRGTSAPITIAKLIPISGFTLVKARMIWVFCAAVRFTAPGPPDTLPVAPPADRLCRN